MFSFELVKSIGISGYALIVNKDSVSVIDPYLAHLSIVLPDYTVIGPTLLGYEHTSGGSMLNLSDSVTTDKGFYISSYCNEIRIRRSYREKQNFDVIRGGGYEPALGTFALNSRNHLYTLDRGRLIVYDANEYTYTGRRFLAPVYGNEYTYSRGKNPQPLKEVFEVLLEDDAQMLLAVDEYDNIYTAAQGGDHVNVYNSTCDNLIATIKAPCDVCSIKVVGDKLYMGICDSLEIYQISVKEQA